MSILDNPYAASKIIVFDWHVTFVDIHDAMYFVVNV